MSVALYVCSVDKFSGKSAICVGLGRWLARNDFAFGYMKPLSVTARHSEGRVIDEDAEFIRAFFDLPDPAEALVPIGLTPQDVESALRTEVDPSVYLARLQGAYRAMSRDKDVVLLEGGGSLSEGAIIGLSPAQVAHSLAARVLVVIKYVTDMQVVDDALSAHVVLGSSLLGVLLNVVPSLAKKVVDEAVVPALARRGIRTYGVLPQDHLLGAISVREMAHILDGEILCAAHKQDELVENLMVGAMNVDAALSYFRRKPNKAVVTGGDRPDIQLAALETSTRCLILTGNLRPSPVILSRAEEVGVPAVLVRQDTLTAIEIIERALGRTRFHQEKKVQAFDRVLNENFDFRGLFSDLGVA